MYLYGTEKEATRIQREEFHDLEIRRNINHQKR